MNAVFIILPTDKTRDELNATESGIETQQISKTNILANPCNQSDRPLFCFKCRGDSLSECKDNRQTELEKCEVEKVRIYVLSL